MREQDIRATERTINNLSLVLKAISPVFFVVGLMHLIFGPSSEILLGANISQAALSDPVLDSQNRFYGVSFALYGALFYLCSTDLRKYITVLRCTLLFFFAGGLARLVSIYLVGLPSELVLMLLASEIALPPLLLLWAEKIKNEN